MAHDHLSRKKSHGFRYESDTCICACGVSGQIGYSPVNATPTSLKSVFGLNILAVQCCVPKSYIIIFFSTTLCIYNFLWVLLHLFVLITARVSLTHSLRLHKPHLARHKYIISCRKCDVKTDRLRIGRLTGWSLIWADHAENRLILVPSRSIGASLIFNNCCHCPILKWTVTNRYLCPFHEWIILLSLWWIGWSVMQN